MFGQGASLINLLGQAGTLSWHLVDAVSYQNVIGYFSSHYPPSVILSSHLADELLLKLLRVSAGLTSFPDCSIYSVSASSHVLLLLFPDIHTPISCSSLPYKRVMRVLRIVVYRLIVNMSSAYYTLQFVGKRRYEGHFSLQSNREQKVLRVLLITANHLRKNRTYEGPAY